MSSSSSRYRSHLFNAFSRQSRRLGDRLAQSWRQTKLTATWGAQILVYPLYALYQGTRVVSRQIGQTVQRILPQLQSAPVDPANPPIDELADQDAPVDTPIVRSLIALAGLELAALPPVLPAGGGAMTVAAAVPIVGVDVPAGLPIPTIETGIETATVRVRGIASLLDNRRLVLTTVHNQLLDVLTAPQQTQLQQRIVWELASYRRLLRLRSMTHRPLPLPSDSPNLLPPVRIVQRLIAWMQTSPVAIATNLFNEAALLSELPPAPAAILPPAPSIPRPMHQPRLPWLGEWLEQLSPISPSALSGASTVPAALPPAAPSFLQSWQQRLQQIFRPTPIEPPLDAAAIVLADAATIAPAVPAASQPTRERWWRRKRLTANSTRQTPIAVPGRTAHALPPVESDRHLVPAAPAGRVATATVEQFDTEAAGAIAVQVEPTTTPTATPTWIETEAILVGYVKHPLEQLLEWLDAGMLWIENVASKLWQWLRGDRP